VQLQRNQADFERAGFSIIALTYDSPALQAAFIEANGIEYPMLSDVAARSVQALGILNVDYVPGDDHYGIPYPGIFILDESMTIQGKLFLASYAQRVDASEVLALAKSLSL